MVCFLNASPNNGWNGVMDPFSLFLWLSVTLKSQPLAEISIAIVLNRLFLALMGGLWGWAVGRGRHRLSAGARSARPPQGLGRAGNPRVGSSYMVARGRLPLKMRPRVKIPSKSLHRPRKAAGVQIRIQAIQAVKTKEPAGAPHDPQGSSCGGVVTSQRVEEREGVTENFTPPLEKFL